MAGQSESGKAPASRGPRGDTVETVLTSAFRILIGEGAHALTPQRLHHETGVARTTIYRHWPETSDLIDFMLERATGEHNIADFTQDLHHDLTAAMHSLVFRFNERPVRPLFGALVEHGRHGAEGDIASEYVQGLLRPVVRAVSEALARGDLAFHDVDDLVMSLSGDLLSRHIVLGHSVTNTHADRAVDEFIDRFGTRAGS